jgi:hypothetical protein
MRLMRIGVHRSRSRRGLPAFNRGLAARVNPCQESSTQEATLRTRRDSPHPPPWRISWPQGRCRTRREARVVRLPVIQGLRRRTAVRRGKPCHMSNSIFSKANQMITNQLIGDFLRCRQRAYLDLTRQTDILTNLELHSQQIVKRIMSRFT